MAALDASPSPAGVLDRGADMRAPEAGGRIVREFPAPDYSQPYDGPRVDFRETVYWNPSIETDASGRAEVEFYLSDAVTAFRATAEGVGGGDGVIRGEALITSKVPVSLAATLPLEVSEGDRIALPVTIASETTREHRVRVQGTFGEAFEVEQSTEPQTVVLSAGERERLRYDLKVVGLGRDEAEGRVQLSLESTQVKDALEQTIRVVPRGFPQSASVAGTFGDDVETTFIVGDHVPGTLSATLQFYPSPVSTMIEGQEGLLREPGGCFEQTSSSNYPNIMVLSYLKAHEALDPALLDRTRGMLDRGYTRLVGYETPQQGYEWFGEAPGHTALTAYGVLEFADMAAVYEDVDREMLDRTVGWLMSQRDGSGGFSQERRALHTWARGEVTDTYITYALTEYGVRDLAPEIKRIRALAQKSNDPYVLALSAGVLLNVAPQESGTARLLSKLAELQGPKGAFMGASQSVTMSGGKALLIEATSLAALALMEGNVHGDVVDRAITWITEQNNGFGAYGSTQATVLALKALTMHAQRAGQFPEGATVIAEVDGAEVARFTLDGGTQDTITVGGFGEQLIAGEHRLRLRLEGAEGRLQYSLGMDYRVTAPPSSPKSAVQISTSLSSAEVAQGEGVRLKASVRNVESKGQPMVLARVGFPGGLTSQTWQLDELVEQGVVDFYETRPREVILYWRGMEPGETKSVDIDLLARVGGDYEAPASTAYLYYTDELRHWAEPLSISVK